MSEPPSSPPLDPVDAIAYYKQQYEALEAELAEFQASSQELEAELEKDVEAAERRERLLQEKVESLGFEVDEWKTKYKQSKNEANAAQNALQKEITELRDANRTMQLQLRDIEVQNDDIERQARNTFSSLEDVESKYNMSIERGVMMEEEIKIGEKERETLRIETQRLRDELSDLKVEAEIMQDKLRKRQYPTISTDLTDLTAPNSPSFNGSPRSGASSPLITTPPDTKSVSTNDTISETPTPPSPPMSEASSSTRGILKTPVNLPRSKLKLPTANSSTTPKPSGARYVSGAIGNSQGATPNANSSSRMRNATPAVIRQTRQKAPPTRGLPNSTSLTHIRSLTAQMQRLEKKVQSVRSKLPAPVTTPPRPSPRTLSAMGGSYMPSSVTMRNRKRTTGSTASASTTSSMTGDDSSSSKHLPRLSTSGISRLSFGAVANRDGNDSRSSSQASGNTFERPPSRSAASRPGARTPMGHYSQSQIADVRRARSSMGGSYADRHGEGRHTHSQSVSYIGLDENKAHNFSTPTRRGTLSGDGSTGIPTPSGLPRRKSGGTSLSTPHGLHRRTSTSHGFRPGEDPSSRPATRPRRLSGVGECY
ncbi:nuclear distribution nudE protein [Rutstroemia sp. NJR-2017a WRK4]|nr:nuclear distribution nudE protein [Rutstroemia sp. NJR-2017a WRK4]PQE11735.1 nuclear distribution nudE protein [Rutstroemia sp. NJR-2017a WRK4]